MSVSVVILVGTRKQPEELLMWRRYRTSIPTPTHRCSVAVQLLLCGGMTYSTEVLSHWHGLRRKHHASIVYGAVT
jgi:hypothetical protein